MSVHPNLPEIGSFWHARDGRLMQVESWIRPVTYPENDYWAHVTVFNPTKRRTTCMTLAKFSNGFLMPNSDMS
jgi:hypothetical protein